MLGDPIDTATLQGRFSLQVMGAVAELERALIRERTRARLRAAREQGRIGSNPALRAGDREALRKLRAARDESYFRKHGARAEALATPLGYPWCGATARRWPGRTWCGWLGPHRSGLDMRAPQAHCPPRRAAARCCAGARAAARCR